MRMRKKDQSKMSYLFKPIITNDDCTNDNKVTPTHLQTKTALKSNSFGSGKEYFSCIDFF